MRCKFIGKGNLFFKYPFIFSYLFLHKMPIHPCIGLVIVFYGYPLFDKIATIQQQD